MPESIAVVKLRGFVEDIGGHVLISEPGYIRVHLIPRAALAAPAPRGVLGLLGKFGKLTLASPSAPTESELPRVEEGMDIELKMEKPDPSTNRLRITTYFRVLSGFSLPDPEVWRQRCDQIHNDLRAHLIA